MNGFISWTRRIPLLTLLQAWRLTKVYRQSLGKSRWLFFVIVLCLHFECVTLLLRIPLVVHIFPPIRLMKAELPKHTQTSVIIFRSVRVMIDIWHWSNFRRYLMPSCSIQWPHLRRSWNWVRYSQNFSTKSRNKVLPEVLSDKNKSDVKKEDETEQERVLPRNSSNSDCLEVEHLE